MFRYLYSYSYVCVKRLMALDLQIADNGATNSQVSLSRYEVLMIMRVRRLA
jgi:hypothetical protein